MLDIEEEKKGIVYEAFVKLAVNNIRIRTFMGIRHKWRYSLPRFCS